MADPNADDVMGHGDVEGTAVDNDPFAGLYEPEADPIHLPPGNMPRPFDYAGDAPLHFEPEAAVPLDMVLVPDVPPANAPLAPEEELEHDSKKRKRGDLFDLMKYRSPAKFPIVRQAIKFTTLRCPSNGCSHSSSQFAPLKTHLKQNHGIDFQHRQRRDMMKKIVNEFALQHMSDHGTHAQVVTNQHDLSFSLFLSHMQAIRIYKSRRPCHLFLLHRCKFLTSMLNRRLCSRQH
jgi:hypothetical protein